jgi:hypothetical protein
MTSPRAAAARSIAARWVARSCALDDDSDAGDDGHSEWPVDELRQLLRNDAIDRIVK